MPDRSVLVVRASGAAHRRPVAGGRRAATVRPSASRRRPPANATDVSGAQARGAQVRHGDGATPAARSSLSWPFQVMPDHPPKIALTKDPERTPARRAEAVLQGRGRLRRRLRRDAASGACAPKEDKSSTAWARAGSQEGRAPAARAAAGAGAAAAARLSQAGRRPELPRDRRSSLGRHEGRADAGRQGPRRPDRAQRADRAGAAGAALQQAAGARRRRAAAPAGRGPARPPAGGPRHRGADAGAGGVHRGPAGVPGPALGLLAPAARWHARRAQQRHRAAVEHRAAHRGRQPDRCRAGAARRPGAPAEGARGGRLRRGDPEADAGAAAGAGAVPRAALQAGRRTSRRCRAWTATASS